MKYIPGASCYNGLDCRTRSAQLLPAALRLAEGLQNLA